MKIIKFTESINLKINVGDTLLGGRFKNKQVKVKKIGKDKNGQTTINGKPLLKFRIWNDLPQTMKDKFKLKGDKTNESLFDVFRDKSEEEKAREIYQYLLDNQQKVTINVEDSSFHDAEGLIWTNIWLDFVVRNEEDDPDENDPFGEDVLDDGIRVLLHKYNIAFVMMHNMAVNGEFLKCSKKIIRKIFKLAKKIKEESNRPRNAQAVPRARRERGTYDTGPR